MTFWGGSGSGSSDPCFWLMDPDPSIFVIDLQDASKKLIFNFTYYFCMMREGSGSGSGSTPLTGESGSGRPKNMWIRWIWIRLRIWNTGLDLYHVCMLSYSMNSKWSPEKGWYLFWSLVCAAWLLHRRFPPLLRRRCHTWHTPPLKSRPFLLLASFCLFAKKSTLALALLYVHCVLNFKTAPNVQHPNEIGVSGSAGSGSADPCLWLTNPDLAPDPALFISDFQGAKKKLIL